MVDPVKPDKAKGASEFVNKVSASTSVERDEQSDGPETEPVAARKSVSVALLARQSNILKWMLRLFTNPSDRKGKAQSAKTFNEKQDD